MDDAGPDERRVKRGASALSGRRLAVLCLLAAVLVAVTLSLGHSGRAESPSIPVAAPRPAPSSSPVGARALQLATDDRSIDDVREYTTSVARGGSKRKLIALTFDDGPGVTTPELLKYLAAAHVPATFFLVGRSISKHTDLVRRETDGGFSLGTHTEDHARLRSQTTAFQRDEILTAADRITRISRHAVRLFRPPYGAWDAHTLSILRAERMLMVLWSVDTKDYEATSPAPVVKEALAAATPGAIMLMHDGPGPRPNTLAAVKIIVPALRRSGYRLVSLPELLREDPPARSKPVQATAAG